MQAKLVNRIISTILIFLWMFGIFFMRKSTSSTAWLFALIAAALWFGITYLPKLSILDKARGLNVKIWEKTGEVMNDTTLFFNIWLISFFVFLLAWLAFFPGILGYDAPLQYAMFVGEIPFDSAQQPILHTLLIGSLISLGHAITKSYSAGLAVAVAVQGLLITHCIASIAIFLKKRMVSPLIILAGLLLTFFNPFIQVLGVNVTKDVLFGVFLADFVMAYIEMVEAPESKLSLTLKTVIFGILLCLFRNGLVHALFIMLVVALIARQKKKQIYIALAAVIVFVHLFNFVADSAFGIRKSPIREFLAVPIQQLSHVVYSSELGADVSLTGEQKDAFYSFMPEHSLLSSVYESDTADGPKALIDDAYLKSHLGEFAGLYLNVGFKNMGDYVKTWHYLESGYFNVNYSEYKQLMLSKAMTQYLSIDKYDFRSVDTPFKKYQDYLTEKIDIEVSLIFEPIVSLTLLGLLLAACVAFRKAHLMPAVFLLITYLAGILIGPVALVRYTYPLVLMLPLMLGLFANSFKNEENLPQ